MRLFKPTDLVWAKIYNDPYWPGKIMEDVPKSPPTEEGSYYYIYFFGSHNHNYAKVTQVYSYLDGIEKYGAGPKRKNRVFSAAFDYIHEQYWCLVELKREDPLTSGYNRCIEDEQELQEDNKKAGRILYPIKKKGKRKMEDTSRPIKRPNNEKYAKKPNAEDDCTVLCPFMDDMSNLPSFVNSGPHNLTIDNPNTDRETLPLFNPYSYTIQTVPAFPDDGIPACEKCKVSFGFIGIGSKIQIVMKGQLKYKHGVTMWSKNPYKFEPLIILGANRGISPEDVITKSDVIFCSLPDKDVSEYFRYCPQGIYDGFEKAKDKKKIYVSITGIEQKTEEEIMKSITKLGGICFEVKIAVPRRVSYGIPKSPILLCAGDHAVYKQVKPYLEHVSADIHYFGLKFGVPSTQSVPSCLFKSIEFPSFDEALETFRTLGYQLSNIPNKPCLK